MGDEQLSPLPEEFAFFHEIRVRWAELDPQGIVFNANYLVYADVAVTEYMRAIGFPYPAGLAALGTDIFAVNASLSYRAPARFDDVLRIGVRVHQFGRTSMRFLIAVFREEQLLVSIVLTYVNATPGSERAAPIPQEFVDRVLVFERQPPSQK